MSVGDRISPMPDFQYVRSPQEMAGLLDALAATPRVGIDTEFIGETSYEPILCLLQIAAGEEIWLVDPIAEIDLVPLWTLLTEPGKEIIALAAREELRFCRRFAGRIPERLFDPQIAAGLVGYGYPLSHTNLVRNVLGHRVNGRETFTDWRRRPLSAAQLEYAADDVRHLEALRTRLGARAEEQQRTDWIEAECLRMAEKVDTEDNEERWRRVSGGSGLSRREQAVVRSVWRWRDRAARAVNQPPRRMMRDELLLEVARRRPTSSEDLLALRGFDRNDLRRAAPEIIRAVEEALALPDSELPRTLRREDPAQLGVLTQLISMASNGIAAEAGVDPALLATNADLQDVVRWFLAGSSPDDLPFVLQGWRGELISEPLLSLLDGRQSLRVVDPRRRNPLNFERHQP